MSTARDNNVKKWVTALRSGEFKQGKSHLRTKSGYCCLGVAATISGLGKWEKSGASWLYIIGDNEDVNSLESASLQKAFGLKDELGEFIVDEKFIEALKQRGANKAAKRCKKALNNDGGAETLADLNDHNVPFSEIATVIEMKPTDLFTRSRKSKK